MITKWQSRADPGLIHGRLINSKTQPSRLSSVSVLLVSPFSVNTRWKVSQLCCKHPPPLHPLTNSIFSLIANRIIIANCMYNLAISKLIYWPISKALYIGDTGKLLWELQILLMALDGFSVMADFCIKNTTDSPQTQHKVFAA